MFSLNKDKRLERLPVTRVENPKRLGLSWPDMLEIHQRGHYFVDNTSFIEHVMSDEFDILLFWLPRKYGKSGAMFTLYRYLSPWQAQDTKELFRHYDIYHTNFDNHAHHGKHPCIYLSFLQFAMNSFEDATDGIFREVYYEYVKQYSRDEYSQADLTDAEIDVLFNLYYESGDSSDKTAWLGIYCRFLLSKYDGPIYLLIDSVDFYDKDCHGKEDKNKKSKYIQQLLQCVKDIGYSNFKIIITARQPSILELDIFSAFSIKPVTYTGNISYEDNFCFSDKQVIDLVATTQEDTSLTTEALSSQFANAAVRMPYGSNKTRFMPSQLVYDVLHQYRGDERTSPVVDLDERMQVDGGIVRMSITSSGKNEVQLAEVSVSVPDHLKANIASRRGLRRLLSNVYVAPDQDSPDVEKIIEELAALNTKAQESKLYTPSAKEVKEFFENIDCIINTLKTNRYKKIDLLTRLELYALMLQIAYTYDNGDVLKKLWEEVKAIFIKQCDGLRDVDVEYVFFYIIDIVSLVVRNLLRCYRAKNTSNHVKAYKEEQEDWKKQFKDICKKVSELFCANEKEGEYLLVKLGTGVEPLYSRYNGGYTLVYQGQELDDLSQRINIMINFILVVIGKTPPYHTFERLSGYIEKYSIFESYRPQRYLPRDFYVKQVMSYSELKALYAHLYEQVFEHNKLSKLNTIARLLYSEIIYSNTCGSLSAEFIRLNHSYLNNTMLIQALREEHQTSVEVFSKDLVNAEFYLYNLRQLLIDICYLITDIVLLSHDGNNPDNISSTQDHSSKDKVQNVTKPVADFANSSIVTSCHLLAEQEGFSSDDGQVILENIIRIASFDGKQRDWKSVFQKFNDGAISLILRRATELLPPESPPESPRQLVRRVPDSIEIPENPTLGLCWPDIVTIHRHGMYFVDNTLFIQHVLSDCLINGWDILFFWLPSNSGKSANLKMLGHFLSSTQGENIHHLYRHYKIWQIEGGSYRQHIGGYPVIYLNFGDFISNSFKYAMRSQFLHICLEYINSYSEGRYHGKQKYQLTQSEIDTLMDIINQGKDYFKQSEWLKVYCKFLSEKYQGENKPIWILIDHIEFLDECEEGFDKNAKIAFIKSLLSFINDGGEQKYKLIIASRKPVLISRLGLFSNTCTDSITVNKEPINYANDFGLTTTDAEELVEKTSRCKKRLPEDVTAREVVEKLGHLRRSNFFHSDSKVFMPTVFVNGVLSVYNERWRSDNNNREGEHGGLIKVRSPNNQSATIEITTSAGALNDQDIRQQLISLFPVLGWLLPKKNSVEQEPCNNSCDQDATSLQTVGDDSTYDEIRKTGSALRDKTDQSPRGATPFWDKTGEVDNAEVTNSRVTTCDDDEGLDIESFTQQSHERNVTPTSIVGKPRG